MAGVSGFIGNRNQETGNRIRDSGLPSRSSPEAGEGWMAIQDSGLEAQGSKLKTQNSGFKTSYNCIEEGRTVLILALDTTTPEGSLALWRDNEIVEVCSGDATRTHAERLPGDLTALLARHRHTPADVDRFAVVSGPGGFTGLRVGIATIQGLALVGHRTVFAASTLLLLAFAAKQAAASSSGRRPLTTDRSSPASDGPRATGHSSSADPWPLATDHYSGLTLVGAWMHASRGEVFTALYGSLDDMHTPPSSVTSLEASVMARVGLVAIDEASVGAPDVVAARWRSHAPFAHLVLMGDATDLAEPLRQKFGDGVDLHRPPPLAGVLATVAGSLPDLGVPPHAIVPTYVRRSDAELARDRMAARPGSRS
jgi:tRNA threonylcarbamoyl adenosine modification protein YeaZ